jgi:MOSC domain-containing protein YiiM
MQHIGKIIHLFSSQVEDGTRNRRENITVDTQGIQGDKYYAKDINRSILITSIDSYTLALKDNISMPYGSLGENILLDYNPYHLLNYTKLQIGKNIIIEISQPCTMCDHLSNIDKKLPTLLKKDRGIFAKIIKGGTIQEGDNLYLVN